MQIGKPGKFIFCAAVLFPFLWLAFENICFYLFTIPDETAFYNMMMPFLNPALVGMVCLAIVMNFFICLYLQQRQASTVLPLYPTLLYFVNGFSIGVSLFYAILYSVTLLFILLLSLGMGANLLFVVGYYGMPVLLHAFYIALSTTPLFMFVSTCRLYARLPTVPSGKSYCWFGCILALSILLLLAILFHQAPYIITLYKLSGIH